MNNYSHICICIINFTIFVLSISLCESLSSQWCVERVCSINFVEAIKILCLSYSTDTNTNTHKDLKTISPKQVVDKNPLRTCVFKINQESIKSKNILEILIITMALLNGFNPLISIALTQIGFSLRTNNTNYGSYPSYLSASSISLDYRSQAWNIVNART